MMPIGDPRVGFFLSCPQAHDGFLWSQWKSARPQIEEFGDSLSLSEVFRATFYRVFSKTCYPLLRTGRKYLDITEDVFTRMCTINSNKQQHDLNARIQTGERGSGPLPPSEKSQKYRVS